MIFSPFHSFWLAVYKVVYDDDDDHDMMIVLSDGVYVCALVGGKGERGVLLNVFHSCCTRAETVIKTCTFPPWSSSSILSKKPVLFPV